MPRRPPPSASQREIELKLGLSERQAPAVAAELDAHGPVTTTLLQAQYFDTPDDRLARAGLSLRLRHEGERWVQTLKVSGALGPLDRHEHEVTLEPLVRGNAPRLDPARHADSAAGQALAATLAEAHGRHATLVKRYSTLVVRRSSQVRVGGSLIEAALDLGHVEAGGRRLPLCELELELQQGSVKALTQLARRWLLQHGLWLSAETKSERGRRLLHGEARPAVATARPPCLPAELSPDALAQAAVASCLAHILPNAAAAAAGSADEEHVHQLRVGLRRLRTALRELASLSSRLPQHIDGPLTAAFRQLGLQRDRQTVLQAVMPRLLAAGARSVAWAAADTEPADPGETARAPAFQCALLDAVAFSLAPPLGPPISTKALRKLLPPRLRRLHAQVSDGARRFRTLPLAQQHRVRKRLKRLRYLSEFTGPLFKGEAVQRYLEALHPAQDALGDHHDLVVAHALAEPLARDDADARFAADWLARAQRQTARRAGKQLAKVARCQRFWKKR